MCGCKGKAWHQAHMPIWAVLASMFLHAILVVLFWHFFSRASSVSHRLHVTLSSRHADIAWTASEFKRQDANLERRRQPENPASDGESVHEGTENAVTTEDHGEVYLPQELLSSTATPREEIDLQGDSPPGPGIFRLTLWIDQDGSVTQIDLEETELPAWFTDRIIDKFRRSAFSPGLRDDQPVSSTLRVEVTF